MTYTVEIDAGSREGKNLVNLLKDLSRTMKGIHLIETVEDEKFLMKMLRSKKSGKVSKSEVGITLKALKK